MSELAREQIRTVRVLAQHYDGTPLELFGISVRALIDMALRTHDAEERAKELEELVRQVRDRAYDDGDDVPPSWYKRADELCPRDDTPRP